MTATGKRDAFAGGEKPARRRRQDQHRSTHPLRPCRRCLSKRRIERREVQRDVSPDSRMAFSAAGYVFESFRTRRSPGSRKFGRLESRMTRTYAVTGDEQTDVVARRAATFRRLVRFKFGRQDERYAMCAGPFQRFSERHG